MATSNNSSDAASPTCNCQLVPCSVEELRFYCSHCGDKPRWTVIPNCEEQEPQLPAPDEFPLDEQIPLQGFTHRNPLVFISDKGNIGKLKQFDELMVEVASRQNEDCKNPEQCPRILLSSWNDEDGSEVIATGDTVLRHKLYNSESNFSLYPNDLLGDLKNLFGLTWGMIFGDTKGFATHYGVTVVDHDSRPLVSQTILVYPRLKWTSKRMGVSGQIKLFSSGAIDLSASTDGHLKGEINQSSFQIGGNASASGDKAVNNKLEKLKILDAIFPGMGKTLQKIMEKFSSTGSAVDSYIGLRVAHGLSSSSIELAENISRNRLGVKGEIRYGFKPLAGITIHLDMVEIITKSAGPIGLTIRKAQVAAAKGIKAKNAEANLTATVYVEANVDLDGEAVFKFRSGEVPEATGALITGRAGLKVAAIFYAKARIYNLTGTFDAEGNATAGLKIECNLFPVPPIKGDGVGWKISNDAVVLQLSVSVSIGMGIERPMGKSKDSDKLKGSQSAKGGKVLTQEIYPAGVIWQNH